jgi:hypothetical protein
MLGSSLPAQAEDKPSTLDPRVERILKAALQNIAAAKGLSLEAEVINEVPLDSGQRIQNIGVLKVYVRRPDRLAAVRVGEGPGSGNMYYDGKMFTLYNPKENVYATWDAPATLDALFDTMQEKIGFTPPLSALLREDVGSGKNQKKVLSATYVGRATVGGVACHHVALTGEKVDLQMWVADGVPLIKRVVVTYKKVPMVPQWTATFLNWDFNAQLSDYLFAFDPPPDATRIEFATVAKP